MVMRKGNYDLGSTLKKNVSVNHETSLFVLDISEYCALPMFLKITSRIYNWDKISFVVKERKRYFSRREEKEEEEIVEV